MVKRDQGPRPHGRSRLAQRFCAGKRARKLQAPGDARVS